MQEHVKVLLGCGQAPSAQPTKPGDVLFNGTGTKLVGTEVGPSLIDSFTVGNLTELSTSPTPLPRGATPAGIVVS
jgi:hypothetical protein